MTYSIETLTTLYGIGTNYPSQEQWLSLINGQLDAPLTVVNFFKFREVADREVIEESMYGNEAFAKYAETSVPKVTEVGGHFVLRGAVEAGFIGDHIEQWDLIAIGQYPQRENFLQLLMDKDYQAAFKYRQAALEKQHVLFRGCDVIVCWIPKNLTPGFCCVVEIKKHYQCRPYCEKDFSRICEIHDAARLDELSHSGQQDAYIPLMEAAKKEGLFDYSLVVAEKSDHTAGFAAFHPDELGWLYVDPLMYRQGIASLLVNHVVQQGKPEIYVEILQANTPALRLYQSLGFQLSKTVNGNMPGNEKFAVTVCELVYRR